MEFPTHIVAVTGLIYNNNQEILMMKHPVRGWVIPGGQVEVGEDIITALIREIEEETGVVANVRNLSGVYSNIGIGIQYDGVSKIPNIHMINFICDYVEGDLRTSNESMEVKWISKNEALGLITEEFIYDQVKDMLDKESDLVYRAYTKNPYKVIVERKI